MGETSSLVSVPPYRMQYGHTAIAGTGHGLMGYVPNLGTGQHFWGESVLCRLRWVLVSTPAGVDISTIPQTMFMLYTDTLASVWGMHAEYRGPLIARRWSVVGVGGLFRFCG
jgi:hypothetical protein